MKDVGTGLPHAPHTFVLSSGVEFRCTKSNEKYALRQRRDVHSKTLSSAKLCFSQSEDVADIVFQAIDDSIHHALLMRLGFVFEFAYKKLQDRQKPENWCRSICSLNVIMQRAAMLMAL